MPRPDSCVELRCEYASNPLGIDVKQPRLSWRTDSMRRNMKQSAYRILVSISEYEIFSEADAAWDSGIVESDRSAHIEYLGNELVSSQRYYWRVRIRNERGEWTDWSEAAWWETGLLRAKDWKAKWIEPSDGRLRNALYMRSRFELDDSIASARVYVTSHGVYELSMNGRIVGNDVLQPGYTSYKDRLQYQTYDVTDLLGSGTNVIGIVVGDGWYRGKLTIMSLQDVYGPTLGALIQVCITFRNGLRTTLSSGSGWRWTAGPILKSDTKDGEIYDARMEMPGWDADPFDDSAWKPVHVADHGVANLVASSAPPVRRQELIAPVDIIRTPKGQTVVDFGQNIAGRVRIRVSEKGGATIKLRHGESLDAHGNFSLTHLQPTAPGVAPLLQEDIYIARGDGQEEEHEPTFSVHGFRYVEITGWPGEPSKDNLVAVALYSDMERTGTFECSDPRINRLHENIVWSMKSNSVDIPTDCPTRERAGWAGDVQIFASTGAYLMNTASFLEKWLHDLATDQRPTGMVPNTIPDIGRYKPSLISEMTEGSAGWGDASVIVPWTLYQFFGDIKALEDQYESMKKWIDYGISRSVRGSIASRINPLLHMDADRLHRQPFILNSGYHWEEWLAPGESKKPRGT
ncbi:MAG: family 78 glycoside hydrolase catalytic domain [Candidatus Moranbacteria bacterium]|nr:family 78 glycoside hydrolase catalytic domain [Candidatus Moranbacteria bacterium]